ncbi:ankyrin repeat protein [Seminavis robusta]|uniref:Ankyrin repeat protein n=1 Tax=Seminavis robusta TaxID=568900 RepID=A0A9N8E2J5_9STRA|nr:ankyrin repeat protein [Seminavis robusta]|eukprot:Sro589_g171650.1 ankyrin repeat protein (265) ;mRNA; f:6696-7490
MSSDSTSPAAAARGNRSVDSLLLDNDAIWIQGILPLVGVGQYAFVGAVNKKMNQLYKEYCTIELKKHPRMVQDNPGRYVYSHRRSAEITDTLNRETFCNQPRAEYWRTDKYSGTITPDHDYACAAIAAVGNLAFMQWAQQQSLPWKNGKTCYHAAKNGHLEILIWLRQNGCPWSITTSWVAAQNGHLELLKWARANGCEWDSDTCERAAKNGHLDILKWAHDNGCPWHASTCKAAAENGHFNILKWAHENGCPWSASTCKAGCC